MGFTRITDYFRPGTLTGRKKIYTKFKDVDASNVVDVLADSISKHRYNRNNIEYLFDYERGVQPLQREKTIRADINIEVTDNVANMIKEFKTGYFWGQPALYVQRSNSEPKDSDSFKEDKALNRLNAIMQNNANCGYEDQLLADSVEICGIGYRMVDVKSKADSTKMPFELYTLDAMNTFCVYHNGPGKKKVLGVTFAKDDDSYIFTCYTKQYIFWIQDSEIKRQEKNILGEIPIIEYERSVDRMGCFERLISDMDGLNIMVSDFENDVAQKTQEIWWGNDIKFPTDANGNPQKPHSGQWLLTYSGEGTNQKIQPMSSTFQSSPTLSAINDRFTKILQKAHVPIQQSSSNSTGVAQNISSGWSDAELDACKEEMVISKFKREELNLIIEAIKLAPKSVLPYEDDLRKLESMDINLHFNRRKNYDMAVKANTFATLVSHGIHGRHALVMIDAFPDVEQVWTDSKDLIEKYQETNLVKASATSDNNKIMSDSSDQASTSPIIDGRNTSQNEMKS